MSEHAPLDHVERSAREGEGVSATIRVGALGSILDSATLVALGLRGLYDALRSGDLVDANDALPLFNAAAELQSDLAALFKRASEPIR